MLDQHHNDRLGYRAGIVSIIVNILLFGLKYMAGIVSGSIALMADAWHTLSDSISSIIVIAGVKLSSKKADTDHPFGHGRWEQIASMLIAVILALIAFDFLRDSIIRFKSHEEANFGTIAIIVTIISILAKEGLAQYAFHIERKTGNSMVKADGWHHRTDALSSVIVLAGILLKDLFWWVDSILGVIISIMLFYAVYEILRDAVNKVLGENVPSHLIEKVKNIVDDEIPFNVHPHHFHIHNYGRHQELTFHIKVNNTVSLQTAHEIANRIERKIKEKFRIETTIHVEPFVNK